MSATARRRDMKWGRPEATVDLVHQAVVRAVDVHHSELAANACTETACRRSGMAQGELGAVRGADAAVTPHSGRLIGSKRIGCDAVCSIRGLQRRKPSHQVARLARLTCSRPCLLLSFPLLHGR